MAANCSKGYCFKYFLFYFYFLIEITGSLNSISHGGGFCFPSSKVFYMLEFKSLAARAYPICNLDNLFYSWRTLVHPEPSLLTLVRQVESKWNTCKYRWKILLKLQFILFIKLCFLLLFVWLCTLRGYTNLLKKAIFHGLVV